LKEIACILLLSLLIAGCSSDPPKGATLLPIVKGTFNQDGLDVYELQHGWIVGRKDGIGYGLTFVPKPGKQD